MSDMGLERARAVISNPDGWSRDDILKAAIVLRDHHRIIDSRHPPDQGSGGKPPILFPEGLETKERAKARDRLLLAIADSVGRILMGVHNLDGAQAQGYPELAKELRDAKILFAATLDRS